MNRILKHALITGASLLMLASAGAGIPNIINTSTTVSARRRPRRRPRRPKKLIRHKKNTRRGRKGKRATRKHSKRSKKHGKRPIKKHTRRTHQVYLKNAYRIGEATGKEYYNDTDDIPLLGGPAKILTNKNVFNNKFDNGYIDGFEVAAAKGHDDERPNPDVAIKLAKIYQSSKNKMYKQGIADEFSTSDRKPSRKVRSNRSYKQAHNYVENIADNLP